jgi:hypothetical protein
VPIPRAVNAPIRKALDTVPSHADSQIMSECGVGDGKAHAKEAG